MELRTRIIYMGRNDFDELSILPVRFDIFAAFVSLFFPLSDLIQELN